MLTFLQLFSPRYRFQGFLLDLLMHYFFPFSRSLFFDLLMLFLNIENWCDICDTLGKRTKMLGQQSHRKGNNLKSTCRTLYLSTLSTLCALSCCKYRSKVNSKEEKRPVWKSSKILILFPRFFSWKHFGFKIDAKHCHLTEIFGANIKT